MDNLQKLEELIATQCQDGTWNYDAYQFGLANGLILALAVVKGEDPKLLDAPDEWLEDTSKVTPEDIVHYDTLDGKWHLFARGKAIRPLTDEEVAEVIWGGDDVAVPPPVR